MRKTVSDPPTVSPANAPDAAGIYRARVTMPIQRCFPFLKRMLDVCGAVGGLLLGAPVFLVVAGLVRVGLGTPVLFRQQRPGLDGKPFFLLKFRTMREARGAEGRRLPDAKRLTRMGRWLRSTSLDELPALWNVLRGEMSLVGPRPLLMEYLDRYSITQARRHEVKPGITGWAQVNGRNAISWERKFELDVWYVDHASLALDLKILGMTLGRVLRRSGIQAEDHATMPVFLGSEQQRRAA